MVSWMVRTYRRNCLFKTFIGGEIEGREYEDEEKTSTEIA